MLVAPFYFKSLWFRGWWLIFRDLNLFLSLYIRDRHPYWSARDTVFIRVPEAVSMRNKIYFSTVSTEDSSCHCF